MSQMTSAVQPSVARAVEGRHLVINTTARTDLGRSLCVFQRHVDDAVTEQHALSPAVLGWLFSSQPEPTSSEDKQLYASNHSIRAGFHHRSAGVFWIVKLNAADPHNAMSSVLSEAVDDD
jgi:hypothetical protein